MHLVLPSTTSHKHEALIPTLDLFARLGFTDLDLNLNHIVERGAGVDEIRSTLDANDQRVWIASGGWCDFFDEGVKAGETEASVERQIALARRLGVDAALLVQVRDHLHVGVRAELVSAGQKRCAEGRRIVYLAVAHDLYAAVLVPEGLVPRGDVDDRETPHAERDLPVVVRAEVVGTAMHHDVAHRAYAFSGGARAGLELKLACDPAHGQAASRCRSRAAASSITGASRGLTPIRGSANGSTPGRMGPGRDVVAER